MRFVKISSVLLLVLMVSSAATIAVVDSKTVKKASRLCQKGERSLQSGKSDAAKEAFTEALGLIPAFPDAHIGLGQLAMYAKEFEEALDHFNQAQEGYGELGEVLLSIRAKRYADAQSQIQEAQDKILDYRDLGTNTNAPTYQYGFQISQLENKISQLEAIEPPPTESTKEAPGEIYFYKGNALFQLNRINDAVTAWETCREKSPKFPMVYNNLALAYWSGGRVQDAKQSLAKAEELGFAVNPQFKADLEAATAN